MVKNDAKRTGGGLFVGGKGEKRQQNRTRAILEKRVHDSVGGEKFDHFDDDQDMPYLVSLPAGEEGKLQLESSRHQPLLTKPR